MMGPPGKDPDRRKRRASQRGRRLHYLQSYRFALVGPGWLANIVICSLTWLIPVVGPILAGGYMSELTERLHRYPEQSYQKFEFKRFADFLQRGLYPFLVTFIFQLLQTPFIIMVVLIAQIGFFAARGNEDHLVLIIVMAVLAELVAISLLVCLLGLVMSPLMLRAGLSQDLVKTFDFAWWLDFTRRMWKEELRAALFLFVSSLWVGTLGLLALFVGIYPAITLIAMSHSHLSYQLYEIYLEKGGEPIPLKKGPGEFSGPPLAESS